MKMSCAFDHLVSIKATLINNLDEGKFSDNFIMDTEKKTIKRYILKNNEDRIF